MDTSENSTSHPPLQPPFGSCFNTGMNMFVLTALFIMHILLLPLLLPVLYAGYRRGKTRRSVSTAAVTSHSDILTFNMVALELISVLGFSVLCLGSYANQPDMMKLGFSIFSTILPGQILFHLLVCMERYVAVVHPVTYRGLRQALMVRIRNIVIVCIWLICFSSLGVARVLIVNFDHISNILFTVFSAVVMSFCSLSVVCVLARPGPGNRNRVDQLKQRASHTIMILTGTVLLKFLSNLICTALLVSSVFLHVDRCLVWLSAVWFGLPGSLALPLLFLHRAGKLPGCKQRFSQSSK